MFLKKLTLLCLISLVYQWTIAQGIGVVGVRPNDSSTFGATYVHDSGIITAFGLHDFKQGSSTALPGIVGTERTDQKGIFNFGRESRWATATNEAHVDGYVQVAHSNSFTFPIGDNGRYRPVATSGAYHTSAAYFYADPNVAITSDLLNRGTEIVLPIGGPFPTSVVDTSLFTVSDQEYWDIDGDIASKITLTWDEMSLVDELTEGDLERLTIAGWDGSKWVQIPSTVDTFSLNILQDDANFDTNDPSTLAKGSITTIESITPNTYAAYTFAAVLYDVKIIAYVWLEGAYQNGNMHTSLNELGYLPGQVPTTFFGTEVASGQPYDTLVWNYDGEEGDVYDHLTTNNDFANYQETVVDWVLVSVRTAPSPDSTVCVRAGQLHEDGHIELEGTGFCDLDLKKKYYIVVEHRNHLIVMSPEPIAINRDELVFDFRKQQSYIRLLGFGQKEVEPGVFVMYAGSGEVILNDQSYTDLNVADKDAWLLDNGNHSSYYFKDFDLNGDVNVQDKNLWLENNGVFTDVPRR